jgi:hypothetical protein
MLMEGYYRPSLPACKGQEEDLYMKSCGISTRGAVYQTMNKSQGGQKNAYQKV